MKGKFNDSGFGCESNNFFVKGGSRRNWKLYKLHKYAENPTSWERQQWEIRFTNYCLFNRVKGKLKITILAEAQLHFHARYGVTISLNDCLVFVRVSIAFP